MEPTPSPPKYALRAATPTPEDAATIHSLVVALAVYEREPDAVLLTPADVLAHARSSCFRCLIAEPVAAGGLAQPPPRGAGLALFVDTFRLRNGRIVYLEDLFVREEARGNGLGAALLRASAAAAAAAAEADGGGGGGGVMEWQALDWNAPALGFYERLGAEVWPAENFRLRREGFRAAAGELGAAAFQGVAGDAPDGALPALSAAAAAVTAALAQRGAGAPRVRLAGREDAAPLLELAQAHGGVGATLEALQAELGGDSSGPRGGDDGLLNVFLMEQEDSGGALGLLAAVGVGRLYSTWTGTLVYLEFIAPSADARSVLLSAAAAAAWRLGAGRIQWHVEGGDEGFLAWSRDRAQQLGEWVNLRLSGEAFRRVAGT